MAGSPQDHHPGVPDSRLGDDLVQLDQLILDLEQQPGETNSLMREHLEAARFYRTSRMPQEYVFNLKLALKLVPEIADSALQSRIAEFLRSQTPRQQSTGE